MTLNELIKHLEDVREHEYGDMIVLIDGVYAQERHITTNTIATVDGDEDVVWIGLTEEDRRKWG